MKQFGGLRFSPLLPPHQFSPILPSSNGCKSVNYGNYCLHAGLDYTGRQSHQDHPRPPLFLRLSQSSCVTLGKTLRSRGEAGVLQAGSHPLRILFFCTFAAHSLTVLIIVAFVFTPQSTCFAWKKATPDHKEHYRRNLLQICYPTFFFSPN